MSTKTATLERGKLVPNWVIKDHEGQKHTIWDYRQKSHVALIHDPGADKKTIQKWVTAIAADSKQWDWLNVKVLVVASAPKELQPGAYAIDRYGIFLNNFPATRWGFDDLEREFLYYEAHHC
jgi:hypothetical protein